MIRLNCNNCKAQLSIDDAFAGGVCRCQYCGTIQTVPKHLKTAADSSGSVALKAGGGQSATKTRKPRTDPGGSSGLDALANAVAGSGLAATVGRAKPPLNKPRSANTSILPPASPIGPGSPRLVPPPPPASPAAVPPKAGLPLALIIAVLVILLLLGIIVGLLLKNHGAA